MSKKRDNPWYRVLTYGLEYFGRYYSAYPGFVVDTADPENRNRIRIACPAVNGEGVSPTWAEPLGQWGGKDYGTQLLQQAGDMVWVSYSNGNQRFPYWQHASFAIDEKPDEFEHNKVYGFKTPRGNVVLINDSEDGKGDSYIEIIHHENGRIRIENGQFLLETKKAIIAATESVELGDNATQAVVKGEILEAHINSILGNLAASGIFVGTAFIPLWNTTSFTSLQSQTANIKSTKVKTE